MDSLVTALDAELVVAGETMTRALGNRCRAAHAVLNEVTKVRRNGWGTDGRHVDFLFSLCLCFVGLLVCLCRSPSLYVSLTVSQASPLIPLSLSLSLFFIPLFSVQNSSKLPFNPSIRNLKKKCFGEELPFNSISHTAFEKRSLLVL